MKSLHDHTITDVSPVPPLSQRSPTRPPTASSAHPSKRAARSGGTRSSTTARPWGSRRVPAPSMQVFEMIDYARHDVETLKSQVHRLRRRCQQLAEATAPAAGDDASRRKLGRDALHLQARVDAAAVLIAETERVLDRVDDAATDVRATHD